MLVGCWRDLFEPMFPNGTIGWGSGGGAGQVGAGDARIGCQLAKNSSRTEGEGFLQTIKNPPGLSLKLDSSL